MTTTTPTALVPTVPVFTSTERLALAGFLAGYSGLTREASELDLRQFASWCQQQHLRLFGARRADVECFARDLETRGRARATVTRRLCTVAGFYARWPGPGQGGHLAVRPGPDCLGRRDLTAWAGRDLIAWTWRGDAGTFHGKRTRLSGPQELRCRRARCEPRPGAGPRRTGSA